MLMNLDTETQHRLTKAFAPPEGTRKPSALFMSFAKNHVISMTNAGKGAGPTFGGGVTTATGDAQIDEFLRQWGLDDKVRELLLTLDHGTM